MRHGLVPRRALSIVHFLSASFAVLFFVCVTAVGQDTAGITVSGGPGVLTRRDYAFDNKRLRDAIDYLAHSVLLNVVYHVCSLDSAENTTINRALKQVSAPGAIDVLLRDYGLSHVQVDQRAIMIVKQEQRRGPVTSIHSLIAKAETEEAEERAHETTEETQERIHGTKAGALHKLDVVFRHLSMAGGIENLARSAHLRILFDPTVEASAKATSLTVNLTDVSIAQALRYIFDAYDLKYEEIDSYTINIVDERHDHSSTPLEDIIKKLQ